MAIRPEFRTVPIFVGLSDEALQLLSERSVERHTPAGTEVVREGEPGNCFFLVTDGIVRVCKSLGQPGEVEFAKLGIGDFFGEMCILETLPRAASVVALTDAKLFSISSLDFIQLYHGLPKDYGILLLNMARDLSRRLRSLDNKFAGRS